MIATHVRRGDRCYPAIRLPSWGEGCVIYVLEDQPYSTASGAERVSASVVERILTEALGRLIHAGFKLEVRSAADA